MIAVRRKVMYLTGTRADFGLMQSVLSSLEHDPGFDLSLLVCGQHLEQRFGFTANEVAQSDFRTHILRGSGLSGEARSEMAHGVADVLDQVTGLLVSEMPDLLILLGDRGEMLAGAMAALYLGIPVAHFHGGERSGTVDDSIRRAVSSLSQIHFTATQKARDNLIRAGEAAELVHFVGAPGLDGIVTASGRSGDALAQRLDLTNGRDVALLVFHPVVQDAHEAAEQAAAIFDTLAGYEWDLVVFAPNSDAGASSILRYYEGMQDGAHTANGRRRARIHWVTHLKRDEYLDLIARSRVLVGNSSSGIIEAASLQTPAVNVGDRQNQRERNDSVFDCGFEEGAIRSAISAALNYSGSYSNIYDNGGCAALVLPVLKDVLTGPALTKKKFTY